MKKTIALDLDSVLADIMPPLIDFHNKYYGRKNVLEDHIEYDLSKIWKCTKKEVFKRVYKYYFSNEFLKIKPVAGSKEAVNYLAKRFKLVVITSRPHVTTKRSDAWVNKNFPGLISDVIHTNQFTKDAEKKITKSQVCKRIGADTIIEDALHFANECAKNNITVYLFDQPWNRKSALHKNIIRFHLWSDIKKYL